MTNEYSDVQQMIDSAFCRLKVKAKFINKAIDKHVPEEIIEIYVRDFTAMIDLLKSMGVEVLYSTDEFNRIVLIYIKGLIQCSDGKKG